MSAGDRLDLLNWKQCPEWSFFNKVQCDREQGHDGAHIHDYGNGHMCGWDTRND